MIFDYILFGLLVWLVTSLLNYAVFNEKPASKFTTFALTILMFILSTFALTFAQIIRYQLISQDIGIIIKPPTPLDMGGAFIFSWLFYSLLNKKGKNTIDKINHSSAIVNHDDLYKKAYEEMSSEHFEPASWAKAFANAEGNQDKAKALYIKYRVEQLATSESKKPQVTLAKANTLTQQESKASVYKENRGLVIAIAIVGLVGIGLLVSQMQKPSENSLGNSSQAFVSSSTKESVQKDITSKVSVDFDCRETSLSNGTGYAISLSAKIRNNSGNYIQSILANCSGHDKNKNRTFYEENIVFTGNGSIAIAPGNEAYFWNLPQYQKYPSSTFSVVCQVVNVQAAQIQTTQPQSIAHPPQSPQHQKSLTPFEEKLQKANAGDAIAQLNLGTMYDEGQGVPQDYTQAVYWYRKAADQGIAQAQSNLAIGYLAGKGVPQDEVTGLTWMYISYAHSEGTPLQAQVSEVLNKVAMTQHQIDEAKQRAKAWLAAHPKKN